jgi:hypothetical protein
MAPALEVPPYRRDGKPGEFFSWDELKVTGTGLPNEPGEWHRVNLRTLCHYVLDPLRRQLGPIRVTSGFRAPMVNFKVQGSVTSAHMQGLAADIQSWNGDFTPHDVARAVRDLELPIDQCIVYEGGWTHLGLGISRQRRQFLLKSSAGYSPYPE